MRLSALIPQLSGRVVPPDTGGDPDIAQVAYRSQDAGPGALFVAIPGTRADGHAFIRAAEENGAAAVIAEKPVATTLPLIRVTNSRMALAEAAAAFFGHPSREMTLVGVTGTNGKTTTVHILEHLLNASGRATGIIGTLGYRFGGTAYPLPVTTPESRDLQEILHRMRMAGVTHVVMEVSSHAIDQHRAWACAFDVGVFTNLSHDHLDYHGDIAAYWACKKRWFTDTLASAVNGKPAVAVINTADARGAALVKDLMRGDPPLPVVTVNRLAAANVAVSTAQYRQDGLTARLKTPAGPMDLQCPLVGAHNLDNILSAVAVGCALGIPLEQIQAALVKAPQVPGRLEAVSAGDGRFAFVDYAHTPDALENALTTLRAVANKRLWCVFGCGGDRDRAKRPVMGAIAGRLADVSVITADNPRTESTASILDDIAVGMRSSAPRRYALWTPPEGFSSPGHVIEPHRRAAIQLALRSMRAGDVLLIAGKGHETYQIIGTQTIPFDDREAVTAAPRTPAVTEVTDPGKPLPWSAHRILEAVGGERVPTTTPPRPITGITTDTRTLAGGECFVALRGETHDGHRFVPTALAGGAAALIIDRSRTEEITALCQSYADVAVIAVEDTLAALGRLAAYHRVRTGTPVAAITGSNGKTTTRAMMAAVMSQHFDVLATQGNHNNEIGLPLTLLKAAPRHDWAVLEMGMNHPGEIARLAAMCAPRVGVVTNIGPAHLEFLGTLEGVMHAKGELLDALDPDAVAVINGDDAFAEVLIKKCRCPVTTFGLGDHNTIRGAEVHATAAGVSFTLVTPDATHPIQLSVLGRFMVHNALAAAAVGIHLGIDVDAVAAGLASFIPVGGRMRHLSLADGVTLIDDTYNANPGSMAAAIESLLELSRSSPSHLVIGDMRELGPRSDALHREIGRKAAGMGIGFLYASGDHAAAVADGASAGGMPQKRIVTGDKPLLLETLLRQLTTGSWVLVKGSRAMGMEEMVTGISTHCGGVLPPETGEGP